MAIAIRGYATASQSITTSGTLTITRSSLSVASVATDLMLAFINYNNQNNNNGPQFTGTTPAGWTQAISPFTTGNGDYIVVYSRIATGTTSDDFVSSHSCETGYTADITGIVVTIKNAGTPTFSTATGTAGTSLSVGSVGSTKNLLIVNAGATGGVTFGAVPTGMTQLATVVSAGPIPERGILYQQLLGTPSSRTVTTTTSTNILGVAVAIPDTSININLNGAFGGNMFGANTFGGNLNNNPYQTIIVTPPASNQIGWGFIV